jgi:catechol 2,3-dioxygenase-like lactoylglutathione lyase family enzyme
VLGRFLEWSVYTPDIRESLGFYAKLGFSQVSVGDAWTHPYAVVTDGRLHIGLHAREGFTPSLTFVKPGLLQLVDGFERLGVEFEFRRLGDHEFNEVGWFEPSGQLIRLVEARTFSPAKRGRSEVSICGYFREIGLPSADFAAAHAHWERFGFVGLDEPQAFVPRIACTSDSIDIGLYAPADLGRPTLMFELTDPAASRPALSAAGMAPDGKLTAALRRANAVALTAPEGTGLVVLAADD